MQPLSHAGSKAAMQIKGPDGVMCGRCTELLGELETAKPARLYAIKEPCMTLTEHAAVQQLAT